MSGVPTAALMLALALALSHGSPRRRLIAAEAPCRLRWPGAVWRVAITGCAITGCVAFAVFLPLTTVLGVAVLGATVSLRCRRHRRGRRAMAEGQALQTALDVLVGELRVGAHPVRAFGIAAKETDGPVGAALSAVAARARMGGDVTIGLHIAARTSALPAHWDRLAVCWQLAADHGLAIATLMRAAHRDIAERQRFSERLRSGMAGARATATILAGLPPLGVLLGQLIGARPMDFLLGGSAGGWLLVVGLVLACGGLLWSDRITDRCTM